MTVYDLISDTIPKDNTPWFLAPDIPDKKLNGACSAIADVKSSQVIALADTSLMGSAKEGMVLTGAAIYYRDSRTNFKVGYADIQCVEVLEDVKHTNDGEKRTPIGLRITHCDGATYQTGRINSTRRESNHYQLKEMIERIVALDSNYDDIDTTIPMSSEEFPVKKAYVEILAALAIDDDGLVDAREYAHILRLMTRIELSREERFELREEILGEECAPDINDCVARISGAIPETRMQNVRISIMKESINLFCVQKNKTSYEDGDYTDSTLLVRLMEILNINDDKMSLIEDSIRADLSIMNDRDITDNQVKKIFSDLAGKAGAVGVPLAAVYLTGTLGMSAAGLTSGLAALGMGGLLGFSGMVTGIGVAVLLGVVSYRVVGEGIKRISGDDSEKYREREFFLQQVIKTTQRTITNVIDDINYITGKLKEAVFSSEQRADENQQQIRALTRKLQCITQASKYLEEQSQSAEKENVLIKLPKELDIARMDYLAEEPTKKDVVEAIKCFYTETVQEDTDGGKSRKWMIKESLSLDELHFLEESLGAIEYFAASSVVSQHAKAATGRAKEAFGKWTTR